MTIPVGNAQIDLFTNLLDSDFYEGYEHALYVRGVKVWNGYAHEIHAILHGLIGEDNYTHHEVSVERWQPEDTLPGSYA